jgi:hypothetical protein
MASGLINVSVDNSLSENGCSKDINCRSEPSTVFDQLYVTLSGSPVATPLPTSTPVIDFKLAVSNERLFNLFDGSL